MSKIELELMTPDEVVAARDAASVAYVPIGPIEWHGPHLPLGIDALHARAVAEGVAREVGGVVAPTLYAGSETVRPDTGPQSLEAVGLATGQRVVGMDFPEFPVRSVYFEESAFGLTVREVVRGLKDNGFELVVLVNGHGAVNHQRTLRRIATEESDERAAVLYAIAFLLSSPSDDPGHATRYETSLMLAMAPELVRVDLLPPSGESIPYQDFGIIDGPAFDGSPADGFLLPERDDPRGASAEEGEQLLRDEVAAVAGQVRAALDARAGIRA
jgi:creatinine amidohydrolase